MNERTVERTNGSMHAFRWIELSRPSFSCHCISVGSIRKLSQHVTNTFYAGRAHERASVCASVMHYVIDKIRNEYIWLS